MNLYNIKKSIKKNIVNLGNQYFGNYNYSKFVVITRSRTGSNLFMSLLSSHVNIYAFGELFNQPRKNSFKNIWNTTFSKRMNYVKTVGFKIFYYHPLNSNDEFIWNKIKSDRDIKIIHLIRENILRSYISSQIAHKTQIYGLTPGMINQNLQDRKVSIDIEDCLKEIKKTEAYQDKTRLEFSHHPFIEITFKGLVLEKTITMGRIFNFLNVTSKKTTSNLSRQNPEKIQNLVLNYIELDKALRNTKHYKYLLD